MSPRDAVDRAQMSDPVGAILAFNAGAALVDEPVPHDSCFEYELPDGRTFRVLAAERATDPETVKAIQAVYLAAEKQLAAEAAGRRAVEKHEDALRKLSDDLP